MGPYIEKNGDESSDTPLSTKVTYGLLNGSIALTLRVRAPPRKFLGNGSEIICFPFFLLQRREAPDVFTNCFIFAY